MASKAQMAANKRYKDSGKAGNIMLTMARHVYDDICAYAASRDLAPATCVRDCIRRCMEIDGWPALPPVERPRPVKEEAAQ